MNYSKMKPKEVRSLIREGEITGPTSGMCDGYAQANLVILPKDLAYDFLLFTQRNPKACPVLEVSDIGSKSLRYIGEDIDITRDIPKYRVYEEGAIITDEKEAIKRVKMIKENKVKAITGKDIPIKIVPLYKIV